MSVDFHYRKDIVVSHIEAQNYSYFHGHSEFPQNCEQKRTTVELDISPILLIAVIQRYEGEQPLFGHTQYSTTRYSALRIR